jgi:osmotically-inducible protein OsmY
MTGRRLTDSDHRIRHAIRQQLEWDPALDATAVDVAAHRGVVTLSGSVDSLREQLAAERATKSVRGVRGVVNDLAIRPLVARAHADITSDAFHALALRGTVPSSVQAAVRDGIITLTGTVDRLFQKREAEEAVGRVQGVRGIHNRIEVVDDAPLRDVRQRIAEALRRCADLDAQTVSFAIKGRVATLKGRVSAWWQRDAAERAVASAPGITRVNNRIVVEATTSLALMPRTSPPVARIEHPLKPRASAQSRSIPPTP